MESTLRGIAITALVPLTLAALASCGGDAEEEDGESPDAEAAAPAADPSADSGINPILYYPDRLVETAPDAFQVRFETTAGEFVVDVTRAWSPNGADRLYNLVRNGYYDGVYFYRVVSGFMVQFGMHGEPQVQIRWSRAGITDDPVAVSNKRGTVTYAKGGPNSRTTQLFINFGDNSNLDSQGFAPVGRVSEGMDVVDQLHSGYGELEDFGGTGPRAYGITSQGNQYLVDNFPDLDHIIAATLVDPAGG